jgi:tetratricopeptide (TPR) repeat protein
MKELQGRQLFIEALKEVDHLIDGGDPGGAEYLLAWIDDRFSKLGLDQVHALGPHPKRFQVWVLNEMGVRLWRLIGEELPYGPLKYFEKAARSIHMRMIDPDRDPELVAAVLSNLAFCSMDVGDGRTLESIAMDFREALQWQERAGAPLMEQAETRMGLARVLAYAYADDESRMNDVRQCVQEAIELMNEDMTSRKQTRYEPEHVRLLVEGGEALYIAGLRDDARHRMNGVSYHVMELDPAIPETLLLRARVFTNLALHMAQNYDEREPPENRKSYLAEAEKYLKHALAYEKEAAGKRITSPRLRMALAMVSGIVALERGEVKTGVFEMNRALDLAATLTRGGATTAPPFLVSLHRHAAEAYRAAGDFDSARKHLEQARAMAMFLEMSPVVISRLAHALGELDGKKAFSKAPRPVMGSPGLAV